LESLLDCVSVMEDVVNKEYWNITPARFMAQVNKHAASMG
jgi:UDP-3-O-[3-hydroxymyristoyl] glucosamine N-acyltransferase